MKQKELNVITVIILLVFSASSFGQALHWLSKPQSQLAPMVNGSMHDGKISANGRFISFRSRATNHVSAVTNGVIYNVFVYDRVQDKTIWVNEPVNNSNPFIVDHYSAPTSDGTSVAFISKPLDNSSSLDMLYTKNLVTGEVKLISKDQNNVPFEIGFNPPQLLDDGSAIIFTTNTSLVPEHTVPSFIFNVYKVDLINETFTLLSIADDESVSADANAISESTSPSGRYVAFMSSAGNLVTETVTGSNIYLRDTQSQTTTLVTVQPNGAPSEFSEFRRLDQLSVSNTGHVVYTANMDDLVAADTNERIDFFIYHNGSNQRLSYNDGIGTIYPVPFLMSQINATGNLITMNLFNDLDPADDNLRVDVYQYDIINDQFTWIQPNLNFASNLINSVSASGQQIVLDSGDSDKWHDIYSLSSLFFSSLYLHDTISDVTEHIAPVAYSPNTNLTNASIVGMSANQRYAVMNSQAPNFLPELETDRDLDALYYDRETEVGIKLGNRVNAVGMSSNGRYVLLASRFFQPGGIVELMDEFNRLTLFLHDRDSDTYVQIAGYLNADVNDAGLVVFTTFQQLVTADENSSSDVYLFNPAGSTLSLISQNLNGQASGAGSVRINNDPNAVSVVFDSHSSDLVAGDVNTQQDVFVADWPSGVISRISQTTALTGGNERSHSATISDDGQVIAYISEADNLSNDIAEEYNIYVHERFNQSNTLVSKDHTGTAFDLRNFATLSLSGSGQYLGFTTRANLTFAGDQGNFDYDVFLLNRNTEQIKLISQPLNSNNLQVGGFNVFVHEDISVSPTRVGVGFTGSGKLTEFPNHPNHNEAFLYQQGGPNLNLNIEVLGTGSVGGSLGISCMTNCDFDFPLGAELSLVASPAGGFIFDRWNSSRGQCSDDSNPCQLTIDQPKTIQAIFINPTEIIFEDSFE